MGPPHEFLMQIWKKNGLGSKTNFIKKIKNFFKKTFVKQYSWRSAASP